MSILTFTKAALVAEIKRLSATVGQSVNFAAAAWCFQKLINEYEKEYGEDFPADGAVAPKMTTVEDEKAKDDRLLKAAADIEEKDAEIARLETEMDDRLTKDLKEFGKMNQAERLEVAEAIQNQPIDIRKGSPRQQLQRGLDAVAAIQKSGSVVQAAWDPSQEEVSPSMNEDALDTDESRVVVIKDLL